MPSSPLPGRPGGCIRNRLESAAIRLKQVHSWEDLRLYLIQDEKWIWDDAIVLDWQQEITDYFLERCKEFHDDETIDSFAMALREGQQLKTDTKAGEIGDSLEEKSDHGTVRQPNHVEQTPKSDRIIFRVSWGKKKCDGVSVNYTDVPVSRISENIVVNRWGLAEETYEMLIPGEYPTGRKSLVIDLTWERESGGKTQMTTFEVVPDDKLTYDAEFGQNRFNATFSRKQERGHSASKSLSAVDTSHKIKPVGPRSHSEKSSSSSRRRQTIHTSSRRSVQMSREEFVRQELVKGLETSANLKFDKQEQDLQGAAVEDEEDDESVGSGHGPAHSTPDTSVSAKKSDRAGKRRK